MTFVPNQRRPNEMPPGLRRVLFWILMVVLAAFLWRVDSSPGNSREFRWTMDFVAVVGVFVFWVIIYTIWKRIARRGPKSDGSANRPIG